MVSVSLEALDEWGLEPVLKSGDAEFVIEPPWELSLGPLRQPGHLVWTHVPRATGCIRRPRARARSTVNKNT